MLPTIEKIVYRTETKIYLKFEDNSIKVLDLDTLISGKNKEKQKLIQEKWPKAKVEEFGSLFFSPMYEIGGDTVYSLSKEISKTELLTILGNKRLSTKKLIKAFASLL